MASDPTTITYVADREFVRRVAAVNLDPRVRWIAFAAGALGGVTGFALVRGVWWLAVLAGIGALVAVLAARGIQRPARDVQRALGAQFASLPQPATIEVDVADDGLVFRNAHGSQDLPWSDVASIHQTRRIWFVHTVGGQSLPIPASAITPAAASIITANAPKVTAAS